MAEEGLHPVVVPNHRLIDGISAVRQTLPRAVFDAGRCETGLEALRQYQREWDEAGRIFRQKPLHNWASHGADAFRTLAFAWRQRMVEKPKCRTSSIRPAVARCWAKGPKS
jgi:phage terminase large subunit